MATLMVIIIVVLLHVIIVEPAPGAGRNQALVALVEHSATIPNLANRFPKLDDNRRNWGIFFNKSLHDENDDTDYNSPITIPRPTDRRSLPSKESFETKPIMFTNTESDGNESPKSKRFLDKLTDLNIEVKTTNKVSETRPYSCDVAHVKCCLNNSDLDKCSNARTCIKTEEVTYMCDPVVLREALNRVLSMY